MTDHKKELYVHGIVKDYDESINSINKYLFSENERLNAIIDELEERIDKAIDMLDLIIPELWNISNAMTYKIKEVRRTLGEK